MIRQRTVIIFCMLKYRTLKLQKRLLVRLSRVADGSAGQKKFFKVKYYKG
jgi:hypothetical protein